MTLRSYRLLVFGCAVTWLLLGLHLPALHGMISHGRAPQWTVLSILSALAVVGVAGLWMLLRAPSHLASENRRTTPS